MFQYSPIMGCSSICDMKYTFSKLIYKSIFTENLNLILLSSKNHMNEVQAFSCSHIVCLIHSDTMHQLYNFSFDKELISQKGS